MTTLYVDIDGVLLFGSKEFPNWETVMTFFGNEELSNE